ncbi:MAG: chemotaxis protein CheD [Methanomicrobiales archaeon]|nr:chemotaxis protein CheD [Methanomicrobiales archaeon]
MTTESPEQSCVRIGLGELHIGSEPMVCIGIGSCVALIIHDRERSIGGMAHVMLPSSGANNGKPGKYADTAVNAILSSFGDRVSKNGNLLAKIAGGACMFNTFSHRLNIGERNIECIKTNLQKHRLKLVAEDTGGTCGRTIYYYPEKNGRVFVRRADGSTLTL